MKRWLWLALFGMAVGMAAMAMPPPVAYFSFDQEGRSLIEEVSKDSFVLPAGAALKPSKVSGGYLELKRQDPAFISLGRRYAFKGDFSISLWTKVQAGFRDGSAFLAGRHQAGWYNGYFFVLNTESGFGQTDKLSFYCNNTVITSKTSMNDGAWHHVALVYRKDAGMQLFIDGILEASGSATPITHAEADFMIGSIHWSNPHGTWPGDLDELALFETALSQYDVMDLATKRAYLKQQGKGTPAGGKGPQSTAGSTATVPKADVKLVISMRDGKVLEIPVEQIGSMEFVTVP
jgi:hypothetical protein